MSAIEQESEISPERFDVLSKNIKEGTRPISKVRHVFNYGEFCFEIDVYPEWKSTCIMEIELESAETHFEIPPFIRVAEEVTGMKEYSNFSMSRNFPTEHTV
jgi:CYTH domain-containing protein